MSAWDWTLVGELALALALGVGTGLYAGAHFLEVALLRVAAHPSVRKLANAADRFTQGQAGGGGLIGLIQGGLNYLTGGKFSAQGGGGYAAKALVVDTEGNVVGETDLASIPNRGR